MDDRKFITNLALKLQGTPYIWGGSSPHIGFDCSGFCIWVLQVFEILPSGDWTADGLMHRFNKSDSNMQPGDLIFYGSKHKATHVMMYIGGGMCIGASGGDRHCVNESIAKQKGACVKIKPVNYRSDFIRHGSIKRL